MNLIAIRNKIEKAWEKETSYKPEEWTSENPAWGQCAVITRLMKELLGGYCMKGVFKIHNEFREHYWNRINNMDIDFTWRQMPIGTELLHVQEWIENEMVINNWMEERYNILKRNYHCN